MPFQKILSDKERFLSHIDKDGPTVYDGIGKCWLFLHSDGTPYSRYGKFNYDGRTQISSRVAYLLFVGAIPDGIDVQHCLDSTAGAVCRGFKYGSAAR
jgi:hypothetical protein